MALAPLPPLKSWGPNLGTSLTFVPDPLPGPINREMRHLISSLQNHNHQLKGDAQRYKRKLREVQAEIGKVRKGCLGKPWLDLSECHLTAALFSPVPAAPGPGQWLDALYPQPGPLGGFWP